MAIEIERRFLFDQFAVLENPEAWSVSRIVQGYLFASNGTVCRARRESGIHGIGSKNTLTIKKDIDASSCHEIETKVTDDEMTELLSICSSQISKVRYHLKGHLDPEELWTVDVFTGPALSGLCIAELEAANEDVEIGDSTLIPGCGKEITGEKKYSNYALSLAVEAFRKENQK